jgi:DNA-directed RNA polymerase subunit H (RpoH/RPB5)
MIKHILVPEHKKLNEDESEKILKKYNVSKKQLPRISIKDPAINELDPKRGDIIEIIRESPTIGKSHFYRVVV